MATLPADPMVPNPYRVGQVWKETSDTFTLALEPAHECGMRQVLAGPVQHAVRIRRWRTSHLDQRRSGGAGLSDLYGPFGGAGHSCVREPQTLARRLECGDPSARCWPMAEARGKDVVLVAGGIGLAPLRPAIYQVLRHREDYGRLVVLYGARSPRDLLYRKELAAWARQPDTQVLSRWIMVDWAGAATWAWSPPCSATSACSPTRTVAMLCGPEIMMRFVTRELESHGLARADIYLSMERNMKCAVGLLRPLPVRALLHLQGWPGFPLLPGSVFDRKV